MQKNKSTTTKIEKQKAALYVRVSTHWQIDKDSLPLQKDDLINYSKYALNISEYEIFEDAGYSAKNTDRPAYQQMMSRLRTGEFSHLVVWKIDRISRNLLDFATMYDELKRLGVVFVSKNEQFDTSTAIGEAMLKIILIFAELERKMTSERVTAVMVSRANNGQWNGGRVPFGYDYDKETKTFTINESEAFTVRIIYEKYEETHSLLQTCKYMNERHLFPRSGTPWNPTTSRTMLANPFYVGDYLYNKHNLSKTNYRLKSNRRPESEWILVENHHPAIIERERWESVNAQLQANRRSNKDGPRTYTRVNTHIFAGLLICGRCGSQMNATIDRPREDGYRPSIYLCSRHRRFNDCPNKYVSDITVAPFVLNYISNIIKAQNNFGISTSIETFEKKLLRGNSFSNVIKIEGAGLREMYDMLKSGKFNSNTYSPRNIEVDESTTAERDLLLVERRKKERALARLKAIYLYNDEDMPETEYIIERKSITDDLERIDNRLEEIEKNSAAAFSISDEDFISKASYFIMSQQLLTKRYVNFETLIRKIDAKIIKEFVNTIIKKIVILDGKIISILFKNGIKHKFLYSE